MATGGERNRLMPTFSGHECASSDIEEVQVRMPDGSIKDTHLPVPPSCNADTPREQRLGLPDETVRDVKQRLLRESNYPEASFQDYEMLCRGPQEDSEVMQDDRHISTYRAKLCRGREVHLEIRLRSAQNNVPRPSHPEQFGYALK